MDILRARKKAAERERRKEKPEQPPEIPPAAEEPIRFSEREPAAQPAPEAPVRPDEMEEVVQQSVPKDPGCSDESGQDAQPAMEDQSRLLETESIVQVTAAEPAASASAVPRTEEPNVEVVSEDTPAEMQAQEVELLAFRLGGEAYTVQVQDVREVLKMRSLTPVPNAPSYILGVISLRGMVLPIIDLCSRLGLPAGVRDEKSRILVVSTDEEDVGIVVDRVMGVLKVMPDAIKPTPENIEQGAEFLGGIIRKDDTLYILLKLEKAAGK